MVTNEQVELLVKDTSEMQAQILRKVMLATLEQFHDSHMALKKRAESAESRNKRLVDAIKNLRDVKGRHHTEIATIRLFELLREVDHDR